MKKQAVFIEIKQEICDVDTKQIEIWQHQSKGEKISLQSYDRWTYQDQEKREVILKYYHERQQLEIKYGLIQMYFNLHNQTRVFYPTPSGQLELEIATNKLVYDEQGIDLSYTLSAENKIIADYNFQLIYRT